MDDARRLAQKADRRRERTGIGVVLVGETSTVTSAGPSAATHACISALASEMGRAPPSRDAGVMQPLQRMTDDRPVRDPLELRSPDGSVVAAPPCAADLA